MGQLWKSVDDVLDYAIAEEHRAVFVYRSFAKQAASAEMRRVFTAFVADEVEHFKKLLKLRKASTMTLTEGSLATLKPRRARLPEGELVEPEAAYRFAIRAEKSARSLYMTLGEMAEDAKIRQVFETLAAEELGHQAKLEAELKERKSEAGFFKGLLRLVLGPKR